MYNLKLRHFIFLLILESLIVNTTEFSSSSKTLLYILGAVLLPLFCFIGLVTAIYYLNKKYKWIKTTRKLRHGSSSETDRHDPIPLNLIPLPVEALKAAGDKKGCPCPSFTICQVKYKEKSGDGALYSCEYPKGKIRTLFITSYLEISNVNEITDVYLVFEDKTIGNQNLTPDWVKWLWTSPVDKFNVTVIEFSPTARKVLSRTQYKRLTSAVPVENEDVSVFHYCKESLNFAKGRINKVDGKIIEYSLNEYTVAKI